MSGQNGPDEAARLETALARIGRALARPAALHDAPPRATQPGAADPAILAARLDKLIAEIRALLGPHEF